MPVEMQLASATETLASNDSRLVDVVDGLLGHGVVVRGELWLTVADVELVFLGLDVLLAAPDRVRPNGAAQ
ncbi:gas vesicle protein [Cognatiyoonia sp. IB215446]|uniref:gas vesicle protein n=1 Tax=Cognatiyoonia sp. IB215446 TaxID=3097355 RepID=UPI002A185F4E|nr:gas vesicle protein [Cognatiyoonia sp. IB215446]MDX8348466.1 gas vesicle protein [Cognatiyoonia sp. IB215446]